MKKQLLALLALGVILSFKSTETEKGLARANKTNNKVIFFYSEPTAEYETQFTFRNSIENINCKSTQEIINEALKSANTESANQNRLYDAIIIGKSERDIAITFKNKGKDENSIARVSKTEGKYVFIECEPIGEYEMVDKHKPTTFGGNFLNALAASEGGKKTCPSLQDKIETLIKKSEKAKKPYDGIMYGSGSNDLSIKFK